MSAAVPELRMTQPWGGDGVRPLGVDGSADTMLSNYSMAAPRKEPKKDAKKDPKVEQDLEAEVWTAITAFEQILEAMPNDRLVVSGHPDDEPDELAGRWPDADVLVLDHYGRDVGFERRCRSWTRRILVLDDLGQPVPGHGGVLRAFVSPGQNHVGDFFPRLHPKGNRPGALYFRVIGMGNNSHNPLKIQIVHRKLLSPLKMKLCPKW